MLLSTPLATHEFTPVKHNEFRHLENCALNVYIIIKVSAQKTHVISSISLSTMLPTMDTWSKENINIISRISPKVCSLPTHQCLMFYLPMKYSKKSIPLTLSGWRTQDMLLVIWQMHCMWESLSFHHIRIRFTWKLKRPGDRRHTNTQWSTQFYESHGKSCLCRVAFGFANNSAQHTTEPSQEIHLEAGGPEVQTFKTTCPAEAMHNYLKAIIIIIIIIYIFL